jgi:hypothetical protein
MTFINDVFGRFVELAMAPLSRVPISWTLALVSFVTAVFIFAITHVTSNPQAVAAVERQLYADLLEMRLFREDLRAMGRAMWDMCRHNLSYIRLAFVPALFSFVLLVLIMGQLQSYFGYSGSAREEPVIVTAVLKSDAHATDVGLATPAGVRLESPAIWFPALRQVVWRVAVDSPGPHVLGVQIGGSTYEKTLDLSDTLVRRSPVRPSERLADQVLNPSEPPLPESAPVTSIRVTYPQRQIDILGVQMGWVGPFITLSIVFVLALKRLLHLRV